MSNFSFSVLILTNFSIYVNFKKQHKHNSLVSSINKATAILRKYQIANKLHKSQSTILREIIKNRVSKSRKILIKILLTV